MILQQEVRTYSRLLVVTKGQEVTYPPLIKLANLARLHPIEDKVTARSGVETQASRGVGRGAFRIESGDRFFRRFAAGSSAALARTAYAVGCILAPAAA